MTDHGHMYRSLAAASRNAAGKIDTAVLFDLFTAYGYGEMETAAHMIAMGCPEDLAYRHAYAAIANRQP